MAKAFAQYPTFSPFWLNDGKSLTWEPNANPQNMICILVEVKSYYTEDPESIQVPPLWQESRLHGETPHWPTLRADIGWVPGLSSVWNFPSCLVRNCTLKMQPFQTKHITHDYIWFFYLYTCKEEIKKEKKKHISIKYIDVHFFSPSETNLKFYMLHQQCLPQLKASTEKKNWHELVRFIYESILSCRLTDLNCTSSCRL